MIGACQRPHSPNPSPARIRRLKFPAGMPDASVVMKGHPSAPRGAMAVVVRRLTTLVAVAVCLTLVPAAAHGATLEATSTPKVQANAARKLYENTNASRVRHHLRRLRRADSLTDEANGHARAMARRGTLFHSSGPKRYGVRCWTWGENVGYTSGSIFQLHRAFMKSISHRRNVLNRSFHRVAIGAATDNRGRLFVTLFFCS
jgi:uncharacterized protein YkwD